MSQSQSASIQPHSINPSQYERAMAQSARKDHDGQWSCKLCDRKFNNTVRLVTHILTSCDHPLSTFSTNSAIRVCVLLDPSGSLEMFESYLRVANEEADDESSDHDSHMDTEGTGDRESEESESDATSSEEDDELVEEEGAGTEPWWIEEEEQGDEDDLGSADEGDESSELADDQAILAAQHVGRRRRNATGNGTRPPKNQDFPAAPPHSLSADQRREWTFRRDRKYHNTLCPPPTMPKDHHLTIMIKQVLGRSGPS